MEDLKELVDLVEELENEHNKEKQVQILQKIGKTLITEYEIKVGNITICLLYTSPSPRDRQKSRMPSSA